MLVESINILGKFCGVRDVQDLKQTDLKNSFGISQADVMVLFGGSIIAGGDVFASAIKNQIAKIYIIVGGAGHTTETLRLKMKELYPDVATDNLTEAEIFNNYLKRYYNLSADYLETFSTNCGNNITYLLDLIERENINCQKMILLQDSSMQRRMSAGLKKFRPDILSINYSAYQAEIVEKDGNFIYNRDIKGMWSIERYVNLLLGEIVRLTDDKNGYGPQGKNFIAHVDIPESVKSVFDEVSKVYQIRKM